MQTASAEAIRRGFDDVYSKLVSKRRQHEQPVMFKAATVTDQLPLQSPPTSPFRSPGGGVRSSPVTPIADVKSTGVSAAIHSSPAGAVVQQQQHVEIAEEHTTLDSSPVPLMPLPVPSATTAARRERLSLKRPTPAQPPATQKSDKTVTEAKRAVVDPPSPSKQKQQPPEQPGVQRMSELQSRPRRTSAAIAIVSLNELYGRETMTAPGAKTSTLTPPSLAESPPPQPPPQPPQLQSHQATKAAKGSGSVAAKKSVAVAKAPTSQRKSSAKQAFPASKEEVKNEVLVARRRRSALYIKNQKFAEHATSLASTAARWGIFPAPKPLPDSRVINVDALWTVRQKALNKKAKKRTIIKSNLFLRRCLRNSSTKPPLPPPVAPAAVRTPPRLPSVSRKLGSATSFSSGSFHQLPQATSAIVSDD